MVDHQHMKTLELIAKSVESTKKQSGSFLEPSALTSARILFLAFAIFGGLRLRILRRQSQRRVE